MADAGAAGPAARDVARVGKVEYCSGKGAPGCSKA